ncbi:Histone transcription regulator 3 [Neolecta irregularis DAH-3]|uniref:Histone transcription regulator 3 n=1 Tax=Neolecta irregularis (strain DAH-3) TaxID=1198029 RepID=A0A1U7LV31_NEOID|nr:Histone transcription regulator 3 [Neolecta irregularis DAH-3]|eukprot:OLL26433.1 Histone transcription regulator 3 [Neolecta irregularis DAH-3]
MIEGGSVQSTFTAINAVPISETEAELKTQEVEEALKLYQKALDAHHQRHWDRAASLYDELFQLEVLKRIESDSIKSAKSSAAQLLLYLAYKNHGLFMIDRAESETPSERINENVLVLAVDKFSTALLHDPDDESLWYKTAEVTSILELPRLTRFALECIVCGMKNSPSASGDLVQCSPRQSQALVDLFAVYETLRDRACSSFETLQTIFSATGIPGNLRPRLSIQCQRFDCRSHILQLKPKKRTLYSIGLSVRRALCTTFPDSEEYFPVTIVLPLDNEDVSEPKGILAPVSPSTDRQIPPHSPEIGSKRRGDEDAWGRSAKRARGRESISGLDCADRNFLANLNEIVGFVGLSVSAPDALAFNTQASIIDPDHRILDDFKSLLRDWNDSYLEVFNVTHEPARPQISSSEMMLLDLAKKSARAQSPSGCSTKTDAEGFMSLVNGASMHLWETMIAWFKMLTDSQSDYMSCPWTQNMKTLVTEVALIIEDHCLRELQSCYPGEMQILAKIKWAQALFEIYLDDLMDAILVKQNDENDLVWEALMQDKNLRSTKWRTLVGELFCSLNTDRKNESDAHMTLLRFEWCSAVLLQCTGECPGLILEIYSGIYELLLGVDDPANYELQAPNSRAICSISLKRTSEEISKLRTIHHFTRVFEGTGPDSSEDVIREIEPILLYEGEMQVNGSEREAMITIRRFIADSSLEFRLHLWRLLEDAYIKKERYTDALKCLFGIFELVAQSLTFNTSDLHRDPRTEILTSLRMTTENTRLLLQILESHPDIVGDLDATERKDAMSSILWLIRFLLVFAYYEDTVAENEDLPEARKPGKEFLHAMRDMFVGLWIAFYMLYKPALSEKISELEDVSYQEMVKYRAYPLTFLALVHQELGSRSYCFLLGGAFLDLLQVELVSSERDTMVIADLLQCLQCRYDLTFEKSWLLTDHGSPQQPLEGSSAIVIAALLLPLIPTVEPWQLILPQNPIWSALGEVGLAIGPPPIASSPLKTDLTVIDTYIEGHIRTDALFESLKGRGTVLQLPGGFESKVDQSEALFITYFIMGKTGITQYKNRKSTTQNRETSELEYAQDNLRWALAVDHLKPEVWYALAHTYVLLVEDYMSWSADAIRKEQSEIVALQKKATLSFMAAVTLVLNTSTSKELPSQMTLSGLFFEMGNHIYGIAHEPLALEAFKCNLIRLYSRGDGTQLEHNPAYHGIGYKQAFPNDWRFDYNIGKCLLKLNKDPVKAIRFLRMSTERAPVFSSDSNNEEQRLLEPHYKLFTSSAKLVLSNKIDPVSATDLIKDTRYCPAIECVELDYRTSFFCLIQNCLQKLVTMNTSVRHHRSTYMHAKIQLEVFGNIIEARKEMGLLASTGTKLFPFWRPGRFFIHTNKYAYFSLQMIESDHDLETLLALAKKIRRSTNQIWDVSGLWEYLCKVYIKIIRDKYRISHTEDLLGKINQEKFSQTAPILERFYAETDTVSSEVGLLREIFEFRKLNAGLIPPADIDELMIDVYSIFFQRHIPGSAAWTLNPPPRAFTDYPLLQSYITQSSSLEPQVSPQPKTMSVANLLNDAYPISAPPLVQVANVATTVSTPVKSLKIKDILAKAMGICKPSKTKPADPVANKGSPVPSVISDTPHANSMGSFSNSAQISLDSTSGQREGQTGTQILPNVTLH